MNFKEYATKQGTADLKDLTFSILQLEETLIDTLNTEKAIEHLADVFSSIFKYSNKLKVDITASGVLEYWKMNIKTYVAGKKMSSTEFLYDLRASLRGLYRKTKEENYLFDMALKTMLFIDSLEWSMEMIINKSLPIEKEIIEIKEEEKVEEPIFSSEEVPSEVKTLINKRKKK